MRMAHSGVAEGVIHAAGGASFVLRGEVGCEISVGKHDEFPAKSGITTNGMYFLMLAIALLWLICLFDEAGSYGTLWGVKRDNILLYH